MNKVLIIDASESDGRIMSGLLTRAGYAPIVAESIEAGKNEVAVENGSRQELPLQPILHAPPIGNFGATAERNDR